MRHPSHARVQTKKKPETKSQHPNPSEKKNVKRRFANERRRKMSPLSPLLPKSEAHRGDCVVVGTYYALSRFLPTRFQQPQSPPFRLPPSSTFLPLSFCSACFPLKHGSERTLLISFVNGSKDTQRNDLTRSLLRSRPALFERPPGNRMDSWFCFFFLFFTCELYIHVSTVKKIERDCIYWRVEIEMLQL